MCMRISAILAVMLLLLISKPALGMTSPEQSRAGKAVLNARDGLQKLYEVIPLIRTQYKIAVSQKDSHTRAKIIATFNDLDRDLQVLRYNVKANIKQIPIAGQEVLADIEKAFGDLEATQAVMDLLDIQYGYEPEGVIREYLKKQCPKRQ